jgi:hypothetical protein
MNCRRDTLASSVVISCQGFDKKWNRTVIQVRDSADPRVSIAIIGLSQLMNIIPSQELRSAQPQSKSENKNSDQDEGQIL